MRRKGYKGRCEKKSLGKSQNVCRTYNEIQSVYADMLQNDNNIQEITDTFLADIESLSAESRKTAYERYTMIAPLLPFVSEQKKRKELIKLHLWVWRC